jgi:hypothetical protein
MLSEWVSRFGLLAILLPATGCVCVTTGRPGMMDYGTAGFSAAPSSGCDSCGGPESVQGFYGGAGPLSRFFGIVGCGNGGCGELYVDEWINEPPTDDCCPSHECLRCGTGPLQNLIQLIRGRQYLGGCETCSSGGSAHYVNAHETVHDSHLSHGSIDSRGCNCNGSGHSGVSRHLGGSEIIIDGAEVESVDPSAIYGPSPSRPQNSGKSNGGSRGSPVTPKPAPALSSSSANRLNPAMRRVVR